MTLIGRDKIEAFGKKHSDSRDALATWVRIVEEATWTTTTDVRQRFGSADFLSQNRVIFNIKGNHYRLVVKVRYQNGIVMVKWIGTHAQYDKKKF